MRERCSQLDLNLKLIDACLKGDTAYARYLLSNPTMLKQHGYYAQLHCRDYYPLRIACEHGHMDILRLAFTEPAVEEKPDINMYEGRLLRIAALKGQLEVVKFLLTSPEIIAGGGSHADIHMDNDKVIMEACSGGHVAVVRYLLTSPEIIKAGGTHASIHANNYQAFFQACIERRVEVLRYLICDYQIEHRPIMKELDGDFPDLAIETMFQQRQLNQTLQKQLPIGADHRRLKI